MDTIMSFLDGGLAGGLFGILGGLGTAWLKAKADKAMHQYRLEEKKLDHKYNLQMVKAETDATIAEVNANIKRDQIMTEGQMEIAEMQGRNEAILKLSENYVKTDLVERMMFNESKWTRWLTMPIAIFIVFTHGLVDITRTLVRPVVTYGSIVFSAYVTYIAFGMYQELDLIMSSENLHEIIMTMLRLLTFTTSTVIGFWFMDKSMSRKFQKEVI